MTWTDLASRVPSRFLPFYAPWRLRIRTKLLAVLIPSVVAILFVAGYLTYVFSQQFLQTALERIGIVQTMALAKALEDTLAQGRRDLLLFATEDPEPKAMQAYLDRVNALRPFPYLEFGYLDMEGHGHVYFTLNRGRSVRIPDGDVDEIRPSPFQLLAQAREIPNGQARLGQIEQLEYRLPLDSGEDLAESTEAFRLFAPHHDATGKLRGMYVLAIGARDLRAILSLYNSSRSPLHSFVRSPEVRYSFLFDTEGWVLFQSEDPDKPQGELTTYLARSGYSGTLGRRGLSSAFRPESQYRNFWFMVSETREGKNGIIDQADIAQQNILDFKAFYMPYAPVRFQGAENAPPVVVAGVANMDKSRLTLRAGYKQVDVLFIVTLAAVFLVTGIIILLARTITRPIFDLSRAVTRIETSGELAPIVLPDHDHETTLLKNAINAMVEAIKRQLGEIRAKDHAIEQAHLRERANLPPPVLKTVEDPFPELKGTGPLMEHLKADLAKAAQAEADVLVTGETGTGKQLVAEAIHRHGHRSQQPFISINCGALDENLLLDTLFGHVKGAFTEARSDRKGAFLEAAGGILFLDEIQTATPKVQQALLRAVSMRRVRPLGSDKEIAVDVRLIAATNVDLHECIAKGTFREDLYFRLNVISVTTPPLRLHKMSISILVHHFLKQASSASTKPGLGLSRGALAKLTGYDWPGNIRELKHCILRAAIMSEQSIIQDADIVLDAQQWPMPETLDQEAQPPLSTLSSAVAEPAPPPPQPSRGVAPALSPRQARVLPVIISQGSITRGRYQTLLGGIPQRTAAYDLKDLVEKGLLEKRGSGPATRYEPTLSAIEWRKAGKGKEEDAPAPSKGGSGKNGSGKPGGQGKGFLR
jgi:two-component system, NtrC family, response regulator HydG